MAEHIVRGRVVFPGAAYLEMARGASSALAGVASSAAGGISLSNPSLDSNPIPNPIPNPNPNPNSNPSQVYANMTRFEWAYPSGVELVSLMWSNLTPNPTPYPTPCRLTLPLARPLPQP